MSADDRNNEKIINIQFYFINLKKNIKIELYL